MRPRRSRRSLGWDLTLNLILGEMVLAVVLIVTLGTFSVINVVQQRAKTIEEVSVVVAAGLMPLLADQQQSQVEAQLDSILQATDFHDIQNISIIDSSGQTIASHGEGGMCMVSSLGGRLAPIAFLTQCQLVRRPIVIDGLTVATAYVSFAPLDPSESLRVPLIAAAIVLVSVVLVSAPWSAWRFTRVFIEPIQALSRYATRIADGHMDELTDTDAAGEIGELQGSLNRMATELRVRESELLGSYDALSGAYESLQDAKREIEHLSALKTDFVAVAAHEIRSPLSTVTLYSELLESGELAQLDETSADAVKAISAAAVRLNAISSDLMDSALLERGRLPIHFSRVWLDEVVTTAVVETRAMADERRIRVEVDGELPEMVVQGDALRLRQVFDNLLSNAVKYSPEGTAVSVRARTVGDYHEVDIADEGRGIRSEDRERVFTLFVRLDLSDDRDTGGLGLGLAISARIIDAHGGTISVADNPNGVGSVFTVRLPASGSADSRDTDTTVEVVRGRGGA